MVHCSVFGGAYFSSQKDLDIVKSNLKFFGVNDVKIYSSLDNYCSIWPGDPQARLQFFYDAWNSNSDFMMATRGGSGIAHFFQLLKKEKLLKKKLFCGYSDLTLLLLYLHHSLGIISLHGPNALGLNELDLASLKSLKKALEMKDYSFDFSKKNILIDSSSNVKGQIIGGNLSRLVEFLAHYELDMKDKIVFIEDINVSRARLIDLLYHMKNHKNFKPKALLIGDLGMPLDKELISILTDLYPRAPLLFNLPFGHKIPNITIPIGADCEVDFKNKKIKFIFPESEKKYSVKFPNIDFQNIEGFAEAFPRAYKGKNYWPKFNKKKSIKSILKIYKSKNYINSSKFKISGLRDREIRHLSSPIWIKQKKYIVAEISESHFNNSETILLKKDKEKWIIDRNLPELSQPKIMNFSNKVILLGKNKNKNKIYSGADFSSLKKINELSSIQDLSLVDLKNKIGVFIKKDNGIKYLEVGHLNELNDDNFIETREIMNFHKGEWGNIVQAIQLKNGKMGVLGYLAHKYPISGSYFYYPFVFCFDSETYNISSMRIILKRGELPEGDCLSSEFYNIILPGGIIRREDGSAELYASVGSLEGYKVKIKDPFIFYEKKF